MTKHTDINGDPRYAWQDTPYYFLLSTLDQPELKPLIGILDSEDGGYIAYITDEASARRIVAALDAAD